MDVWPVCVAVAGGGCLGFLGAKLFYYRLLDAQQAVIDALMLEYCPEDMTQEQFNTWALNQRAVKINETRSNSDGV